ncbi:hypothetical protein MOKP4_23450 [Mycobacterium avium subsp. hominissuis]|nr:hypothetical protein [Mycobacterium avium subsp. hominissuis]PBA15839.1 hypothetical protein CKJ69_11450 [Mycobacterium avium]MBZ4549096.1 hypothetical protein [Mycobacterium avium subsp. hominissuis]MBZ4579013.1 hypothetical protein [Mycobacterium avium subsp. hominissuis]MBZ4593463.1 hypothetical protein [Mycobacterium avium subsp. hominissuis]
MPNRPFRRQQLHARRSAEVVARTPELRAYHRAGFFTDGRRATWEYPWITPEGEQMDFVEVMEIEDGLIRAPRGVFTFTHHGAR